MNVSAPGHTCTKRIYENREANEHNRHQSKTNVELVTYVSESQRLEEVWNTDIPLTFYIAAKQEEYIENRKHGVPNVENILTTAQFLVGASMKITIYLCDKEGTSHECVLLYISHMKNTIRMRATEFLKSTVFKIDHGLHDIPRILQPAMELEVNEEKIHAQFLKDDYSSWIILRQYNNNHCLMQKLHISLESWMEIKKLVPVIQGVVDHYNILVVQGRNRNLQEE